MAEPPQCPWDDVRPKKQPQRFFPKTPRSVRVKCIQGEILEDFILEGLSDDLPVMALKLMIHDKTGVPTERQRLIYMGRELSNKQPLRVYSIVEDHVIHLSVRPAPREVERQRSMLNNCQDVEKMLKLQQIMLRTLPEAAAPPYRAPRVAIIPERVQPGELGYREESPNMEADESELERTTYCGIAPASTRHYCEQLSENCSNVYLFGLVDIGFAIISLIQSSYFGITTVLAVGGLAGTLMLNRLWIRIYIVLTAIMMCVRIILLSMASIDSTHGGSFYIMVNCCAFVIEIYMLAVLLKVHAWVAVGDYEELAIARVLNKDRFLCRN